MGISAGDYHLEVRLDAETEKSAWASVGTLSTPSTPAIYSVGVLFTDPQSQEQVELTGYTLAVNGTEADLHLPSPPLAHPGDRLTIQLYWRARRELSEDYHSFLHLVGHDRRTLAALDKMPGQEIARPRFWDQAYVESDTYHLRIPSDAQGGLYYPRVGFYDYDDLDRFLVTLDETTADDAIDLMPIKVVAPQKATPQHPLQIRYGDFGSLLGYTLTPDNTSIQPGATLTITLFYRGVRPADRPYTQFFHLYSPDRGMAGQLDQPPLRGGNPTNTWQPGEIILEQVSLTVSPDALPGQYVLNIGMYDPETGDRVPLVNDSDTPLPDRQLPLMHIQVVSSSP